MTSQVPPWAPGAPGAVADVIFMISDLENLLVRIWIVFFLRFEKTPIDNVAGATLGTRCTWGNCRRHIYDQRSQKPHRIIC